MIKLFVVGFPRDLEQEELQEIFARYGEVASATIITDQNTGTSKAYGFVTMDDAGALKAMNDLDGGMIDDRTISVRLAHQGAKAEKAFSTRGGPVGKRPRAVPAIMPVKTKRPRLQR
ncbi:MAG: hypothetical protein JKY70_05005 [Mucilaginibacter sp.]|nr:hypothetical protein [Mucilaginibacter sp.]